MEFYKDPIFITSLAGAIAAGLGTWWIRKTKLQEQKHFLSDKYAKEVEDITEIIIKWTASFGGYTDFLRVQPKRTKEVFQHIYTFDKSFFDKLKESIHIQNTSTGIHQPAREEVYYQFWAGMKGKIDGMSTSRPEFGYCDDCKDWLDKKQRRRCPNIQVLTIIFGIVLSGRTCILY